MAELENKTAARKSGGCVTSELSSSGRPILATLPKTEL
jgi:hypothetical protein